MLLVCFNGSINGKFLIFLYVINITQLIVTLNSCFIFISIPWSLSLSNRFIIFRSHIQTFISKLFIIILLFLHVLNVILHVQCFQCDLWIFFLKCNIVQYITKKKKKKKNNWKIIFTYWYIYNILINNF